MADIEAVDSGGRGRRMRGFRCFLHPVVCEEKKYDSLEREQSIYYNCNGYLRTRICIYT